MRVDLGQGETTEVSLWMTPLSANKTVEDKWQSPEFNSGKFTIVSGVVVSRTIANGYRTGGLGCKFVSN
jgi:hypothetical protein